MEPLQETPKAAAAYAQYEALPDRSMAKLAESLYGKSTVNIRQLEKWSSQYQWQQRVQAYDATHREREKQQREADEAIRRKRKLERDIRRESARDRMDDERSEVFRSEWAKLLKTINDKISGGDMKGLVALGSLLNRALDEERLSLGSPTQMTALTGMDGGALQVQFVLPHVLDDEGVMPNADSNDDRD